MINLLVALRCEADPVIEHYRLRRRPDCHAYETYTSADDAVCLVICRPGKMQAAAATAWLAGEQGEAATHRAWLNYGIAGHRQKSPGHVLMADKILDVASDYRFYPYVHGFDATAAEMLCTVDRPEQEFARNAAYDMEASGFYTAALRFSTVELVQCLKIVSDNLQHKASGLDEQAVKTLIGGCLPVLCGVIDRMHDLAAQWQAVNAMPALYTRWREQLRFSQTRSSELKVLLQQFMALDDLAWLEDDTHINPATIASAKELLRIMRQRINTITRMEL